MGGVASALQDQASAVLKVVLKPAADVVRNRAPSPVDEQDREFQTPYIHSSSDSVRPLGNMILSISKVADRRSWRSWCNVVSSA